ncbi:MAG: glycosyltransferase family 9 protein [Bdellovibrionales bacterium]|nr:glycosyltransferase family 9 protein [Bdellovibrionales bacterium]
MKNPAPYGLGLVDVVYEYNKSHDPSLGEWVKTFRSHKFDLLICPHQSIRSQLAVLQIKARKKIGFWKAWNFFVFDQRVCRSMRLPDYLRQLELLTAIDPWLREKFKIWKEKNVSEEALSDLALKALPQGVLESEDEQSGGCGLVSNDSGLGTLPTQQLWMQQKSTILVAPGSQWNTKRWTPEGFRELTEKLLAANYHVAFIGSSADTKIVESLRLESSPNINDWTGRTSPSELLILLKSARALVTNDSGPMHLASLANCPTVAIFGPTTLALGYQPLNDRAIIVQEPLLCRPCGLHGHEKCPIGTHDCMKRISADRVFEAVLQVTQTQEEI